VSSQLHCPEGDRRRLVRDSDGRRKINGIDHLEVLPSQRTLLVHCFQPVTGLDEGNIVIEGGTRIRSVKATRALPGDAPELPGLLRADELAIVQGLAPTERQRALVVRTDSSGDFSTYTLRLVEAPSRLDRPPTAFDPIVSAIAFSFKVDCESRFDCAPEDRCEQPSWPSPQIDYLAKDYASFRRLMLDRLAVIMPDWRERNPADVLVTVVELLAYGADMLSYFQDAAATEAYLATARWRSSVRRHARLVDYRMHDGMNARTWVAITAGSAADQLTLDAGTAILTGEVDASATMGAGGVEEAVSRGAVVFETLHPVHLRAARDQIAFHTWGDDSCCLPTGATRATLVGGADQLQLARGDVLVLEEVRGPQTDRPEDADPDHRHVVRLNAAPAQLEDPLGPTKVVEVQWAADDALPFTLCLRASVARGNVALADHGRWLKEDRGGKLLDRHEPLPKPVAGRAFRPRLERSDLTQAAPYHHDDAQDRPAAQATRTTLDDVLPQIYLLGEGETWEPVRELLASERFATRFVVETEEDGRATLRFGDDVLGRQPSPQSEFVAAYRVGNGRRGNVGAGALSRMVTDVPIKAVTNPLPATGGTNPEPLEQVKLYAPQAFRTQRRAVTADDYVAVSERHPEVQRAGATRRWTGSWYTTFVTIDRAGGREIDADFEEEFRRYLDPYRLAGHDVEIDAPRYVPLDVAMLVCVAPGYVRSDVQEALLEALGSRQLPGGGSGFFHPDKLTFGQPVYLSPLVAAAMAVPGVGWVQVTRFQRFGEDAGYSLDEGRLAIGRLEIAQLDNDPNRPENGRLELDMKGGL
jgi:hypothetical protein